MSKFFQRSKHRRTAERKRERGQGIVEYVLILAFASIVVIAIVRILEPQIGEVFSTLIQRAPVAPPALLGYTPPPTSTDTAPLNPFMAPSTPTQTPNNRAAATPTHAPTATSTPPATTPTSTDGDDALGADSVSAVREALALRPQTQPRAYQRQHQ